MVYAGQSVLVGVWLVISLRCMSGNQLLVGGETPVNQPEQVLEEVCGVYTGQSALVGGRKSIREFFTKIHQTP